jgi:hypothetical protein
MTGCGANFPLRFSDTGTQTLEIAFEISELPRYPFKYTDERDAEWMIVRQSDHGWWHVAGALGLVTSESLGALSPNLRPRSTKPLQA